MSVALQLTTFRQLRLSLPATRNARAAGVDIFSVPQSGVKGGEKVYRCGGTGTADYTLPPEIVNGKGYWVWSERAIHTCDVRICSPSGAYPEKTWYISSSVPGKTGRSCRLWIWLPLPIR